MDKPHGLMVHRSSIASEANEFALQSVRDQTGKRVYPVHRLDRGTSGALLFAFSSEIAATLSGAFAEGAVGKVYHAIVRGVPPLETLIDYPLREELDPIADRKARQNKPAQDARTLVKRIASFEIPERVDKFPTSRYSLVQALPQTGRKHQIRRHLRHIGNPIVGDVTHGVGKHNRYFAEKLGSKRMLLACTGMVFKHPRSSTPMKVSAPLSREFRSVLTQLEAYSYAPT